MITPYPRRLRVQLLHNTTTPLNLDWKSHADGYQGAIISIGAQTDSVLDRFDLDDKLVPRLRVLTQTVRSSRWETVLRSRRFGLTYEQAAKLTDAMLKDIERTAAQPSPSSCGLMIFSIILTIVLAFAAFIYI